MELIKWPAIIVRGEPVTEDQAAEIILRTCGGYFGSNDRQWIARIHEILELPTEKFYGTEEWRKNQNIIKERWDKLGLLELEYLSNSQICSAWAGGCDDGWMKWDGEIKEPDGRNIGKYPSVEGIKEEWRTIAEAFPYLDLTCQLWNCEAWFPESCDNDPKPVVQFDVVDGKVSSTEFRLKPIAWPQNMRFSFSLDRSERGCTEEQLIHARDLCLKRS